MGFSNVSFRDVNIKDGFWAERQALNRNVTVHSVRDRFADTGRFEAFRFNWKEGMPDKPHFFWDSDVAKWLEAVAYIIEKEPDPLLEKQVDEVVDLIAEHQGEDGYFNIYFTVCEPDKRFSNRDRHELYCAGHLTEAAVAYYNATGKDKFLKCMCRYIDYIEKVFKIEGSAAFQTPGHEEIELALVKLYHCTGEKRYLDLSKHFIDMRGCQKEIPEDFWAKDMYYQSHKPCREQTEAAGHSVRACYLYTGMADIAREYNDDELLDACEKLFDDIYYKKMYVTGGIGQSYHGEAFTVPYDLQNGQAYTETCAAIALVYFASRMQSLKLNSHYGDVIERAIYNGILSGVSLDGKSFFYENPLEIVLSEHGRNVSVNNSDDRHPITQRLEVFSCSCCPPNITRFIASIGDYIYGVDENTVYVHQFISSDAKINGVKISQKSGYPYDGKVAINVSDFGGKRLAVRIPEYTKNSFTISSDYEIQNGYAFIDAGENAEIQIEFDVTPKRIFANPMVDSDAGKCTVTAGPLVYCAEGIDNGGRVRKFRIPEKLDYRFETDDVLKTRNLIIKAEKAVETQELYYFDKQYETVDLKLIPYFAFANRGESDMAVWLNTK